MKIKLISSLVLLCLATLSVPAQKLTIGIESGTNFSNLRKTFDYERFASVAGPINGFVVKYDLSNWIYLSSGANHTSYCFNEANNSSFYDKSWLVNSYLPVPEQEIAPYFSVYTPRYNFLRIPLLLKFKTPGRVNLEFGGGAYYAFLTNDEFRGKDRDLYTKEYIAENFPKMTDWGWILASSLNYQINNRWSVFVNGQVTYGHENYFKDVEGKMGSSEISLGIGYRPFATEKLFQIPDSVARNVSILPHSGIIVSQVKSSSNTSKYKPSVGLSSGISYKFQLDNNPDIIVGTWYDRKGYKQNNNGEQTTIYIPADNQPERQLLSEVQLDYLTVPILLDISIGRKIVSHFNIGTYFSLLQNAFAEGEITLKSETGHGYQISKHYFNESLDLWFKKYDFGFMGSYQVHVPVFKWADAFVSVNQSYGMIDILNNSKVAQSTINAIDNQKIQNWSTSIHFGLSIPVNQKQKP